MATSGADSETGRIVVTNLSKSFGAVRAVSELSFEVEPGEVTGFLGPNGAGKTTTLRCVLGLARPDQGGSTVSGKPYVQLTNPGHQVGAVLESTSFHPARSARNHLRVFAAAAGVADSRVDEVLTLVGLTPAAGYSVGGFSLGMRQRLALATAMLGDPRILILDEPANGLDPEGIVWLRSLVQHFAHVEGRTVLISSHLLSEVEQTVDRVVIIAHGKLVHAGSLDEIRGERAARVHVESPTPDRLLDALRVLNVQVAARTDHSIVLTGATASDVGHAAWQANVELHALREEAHSLEDVFLELTEKRGVADQPAQSAPPLPAP